MLLRKDVWVLITKKCPKKQVKQIICEASTDKESIVTKSFQSTLFGQVELLNSHSYNGKRDQKEANEDTDTNLRKKC